ncbi:hypothetical protein HYC85_000680 [Camellia sinensis]|uniref:Uncharacterized protein n=1 Tax=Camellia sinensis TaxID=4442 RepID=A0A7J7I4G2_CAMSI|nr:hypothetical protein HYC85_000680 [Camellia sinensis]
MAGCLSLRLPDSGVTLSMADNKISSLFAMDGDQMSLEDMVLSVKVPINGANCTRSKYSGKPVLISSKLLPVRSIYEHNGGELPGDLSVKIEDSIMGDSASYIHMVQHLIEKCLTFNMTKEECMEALSKHAKIEPVITSTVWKELEKENKEFFESYSQSQSKEDDRMKHESGGYVFVDVVIVHFDIVNNAMESEKVVHLVARK